MQLFVVLKLTKKCNLSCRYCYEGGNTNSEMTEVELLYAISWIANYCKIAGFNQITILFHGGEPLLYDINSFSKALEYCKKTFESIGVNLRFRLQTNLIGLKPYHIALIKKYFESSVGTSLDFQSSTRCFKNGENATDMILCNIQKLIEEKCSVNVICMVTPENISNPHDLYYFYKKWCSHLRLARVFPSKLNQNCFNYIVSNEEYTKFLCQLFDIWVMDRVKPISIDNFAESIWNLVTGAPRMCEYKKTCQPYYLSISPGGDLYPCGRFNTSEYRFGSIYADSPETIYDEIWKKHLTNIHLPTECHDCSYVNICNGGCMYEREYYGHTQSCTSIKILYEHIEKYLQNVGVKMSFKEVM